MHSPLRDKAITLLQEKLPNQNLQRHCLAVEAIMRELAGHFKEDEELWGLAGLLHDVDYEETQKDLTQHSLLAAEWLQASGFPSEVVNAVKVHNDMHRLPQETNMEKWLVCTDALSGILVATALILPNKAADLTVERVTKRMKEKSFAKGVKREEIVKCEELSMPLEEFVTIGIRAIQRIAGEIGV